MKKELSLLELVFAFFIYFMAAMAAVLFITILGIKTSPASSAWLFPLVSILQACALFYYASHVRSLPRLLAKKREDFFVDIFWGIVAFAISFPLTIGIAKLLTIMLGSPEAEQEAIRYVKIASANPPLFVLVVLVIVFVAPLVEELLFRGFLQTFLRRFFSGKLSILLTSIIFAIFHFSARQGIGNIVLLSVLFIFSLFSGYLYERRGRLLAPITLHVIFNGVNITLLCL